MLLLPSLIFFVIPANIHTLPQLLPVSGDDDQKAAFPPKIRRNLQYSEIKATHAKPIHAPMAEIVKVQKVPTFSSNGMTAGLSAAIVAARKLLEVREQG
jgi:hypothetical protein